MNQLVGHVDVELISQDETNYQKVTVQGAEFVLESGGEPVLENGKKSTWYQFKYEGAGFDLIVDFVEIEGRIFSYELKSQFVRDQFKSATILEDELDLGD